MTKTIKDEEERFRKIVMVAEYVMETGDSTRKTAEFFSNNFFPISNYSVSEYCKEYLKYFPNMKNKMQEAINGNREKKVDEEEILNRVKYNANLVISEGLSIEQISEMTGVSYWTVYRDLTVRLAKVDENLYNAIKEIFSENRMSNLKK